MMAGNPNWWSMNGMHPQSHPPQFVYSSTSPLSSNAASPPPPPPDHHHHHHHLPHQDFPVRSWSQLLLGTGEEERYGASLFQQQKKLENWEDQVLNLNPSFSSVKPEIPQSNCQPYNHDFPDTPPSWPPVIPASSPTSCITTLSNSILNFAKSPSPPPPAPSAERRNHQHNLDHASECNSTGSGGASKKARVQSSAQPALKVRKEKLGERITALHQIVSPFGKTDTASVLSEAIGYIRFLQGQIEALSSPYMRNGSGSSTTTGHQQHHSVQERNCLFPQDPPQFLNDVNGMDGRGASKQDSQGRPGVKDLRSRGLCLVPISCTQHVGNDNGADYWAPAAFGGSF